ncbi:spire-like protein 1 [Plakobranchus ocellatus]|uniref:Spire-like protein 1 n=1 Tax=Plakobranchus ocellatus TaxID=259542 RepID=A0AAV3ZJJ6_9GAST|nr:spire-like protein 1 [Plakobranchus ocellatus]
MELLPFVDILKVFNNPINEEQAWAVCYQCAHFLQRNPSQEFYQDVYDSGIHSIWLSRHGDVLLRKGPPDPNGSGKGPPHHSKLTIFDSLSYGQLCLLHMRCVVVTAGQFSGQMDE